MCHSRGAPVLLCPRRRSVHPSIVLQVLEETGYNLEGQLDPDNVLQMSIKEQSISLYIVPGVPEDFPFETKTRKEISVGVVFDMFDAD